MIGSTFFNDSRRDPVRARLMQLGTFHGMKGVAEPFIPISVGERERICEILERESADMVCTGCGCTKTERWLKAMGALSCCDARNMVPATDLLNELTDLRKPKRRPRRKAAP